MHMRKYLGYLASFILMIFLSGCAATLKGPAFHAVDSVPDNKALVYVYWTDMLTEGAKRDPAEFTLKMDGKPLTVMIHSGYYKLSVDTGKIYLSSHLNFKPLVAGWLEAAMAPTETLTFNADPGQIYYVRCIVSPSLEYRLAHNLKLSMMLVDERRGVYELSGAKLLPQLIYSDKSPENNSE